MATLVWEQATYPNTEYTIRDIYGTTLIIGNRAISGGTLSGITFNYVIMNFTRIGDCTGLNVVAGVYNTSSGCTLKKSLGAIDATTIPTSITPIQFPTVTDTTLADDDVIGFYLDGGDGSNKMAAKGKFPFINSNSLVSTASSCSWSNSPNEQLAMQLWSDEVASTGTRLPPPPITVQI